MKPTMIHSDSCLLYTSRKAVSIFEEFEGNKQMNIKEKQFESDIEQYLIKYGGYTKDDQSNYDRDKAIDMTKLIEYIQKTQSKEWKRYQKMCIRDSLKCE